MKIDKLYYYRAKVTSVYDGDTFRADVDLGMSITVKNQNFRIADIDTPEVRGVEREDGLGVAEYVRMILQGQDVLINTMKTGKYGRWIAWVWVPNNSLLNEDESLGEHLLKIGYAVPYGEEWKGFMKPITNN